MFLNKVLSRTGLFALAAILVVIAAACAPLPASQVGQSPLGEPATVSPGGTLQPATPQPGGGSATEEAAVEAARNALAMEFGLSPDAITVVSVEQVDWRDGCLEIARPEVACLAAITPGYRIILSANGEEHEMRTNLDGTVVARAAPVATPTAAPLAAVNAAAQLASQLGLQLNDVRVVSAEPVEWPDACLGAAAPDEMCAQVITPGYLIVLEANNEEYTFHTNQSGTVIRPARTGPVSRPTRGGDGEGKVSILGWRDVTGGRCIDVFLSSDGVNYGDCGGQLTPAQFPAGAHRLEQLLDMEAIYASFAADTPAGKIAFNGDGPIEPGPAEQRMMGEFAAAVYREVQAGGAPAQYGLGWHREGGIAGFCDDISIDESGHATLSSCRTQPATEAGWRRLTEAELEQFYVWLDTLGQFEYEQPAQIAADEMPMSVIFAGHTEADAAQGDKEAMIAFGGDVLTQWAGPSDVRYVLAERDLDIRSGPSEEFDEVGTVAGGQTALVTGVSLDEAWWRVACPDDTVGFCYVSADPAATSPITPAAGGEGVPVTPEVPVTPAATVAPGTPVAGGSGQVSAADEAAILSAAIRRVYTVDHTFGGSPNFPMVYLLQVDDTEKGAAPFAGAPVIGDPAVHQQVIATLTDLPAKFTWVTDPNAIPRGDNGSIAGNGAIVTVGKVRPQPDGSAQLASSIYVGMLAAGGQTYVLEKQGESWEIIGTTGPVWIS